MGLRLGGNQQRSGMRRCLHQNRTGAAMASFFFKKKRFARSRKPASRARLPAFSRGQAFARSHLLLPPPWMPFSRHGRRAFASYCPLPQLGEASQNVGECSPVCWCRLSLHNCRFSATGRRQTRPDYWVKSQDLAPIAPNPAFRHRFAFVADIQGLNPSAAFAQGSLLVVQKA